MCIKGWPNVLPLTDLRFDSVKFRISAEKTATNRVIHRRYLATSEFYESYLTTDNERAQDLVGDDDDEDYAGSETMFGSFSTITPNHLYSNTPLIRSRVIKRLKGAASSGYTLPQQNMILSIVRAV
jgi:hypothetical protein